MVTTAFTLQFRAALLLAVLVLTASSESLINAMHNHQQPSGQIRRPNMIEGNQPDVDSDEDDEDDQVRVPQIRIPAGSQYSAARESSRDVESLCKAKIELQRQLALGHPTPSRNELIDHYAGEIQEHLDGLELLPSVNAARPDGVTTLMFHASNGNLCAVEKLLACGAFPHAVTNRGRTALDYICLNVMAKNNQVYRRVIDCPFTKELHQRIAEVLNGARQRTRP